MGTNLQPRFPPSFKEGPHSFAQAVEKCFENSPETADIPSLRVGNLVGNEKFPAFFSKATQSTPEFREIPTDIALFFNIFPKVFNRRSDGSRHDPLEKSAFSIFRGFLPMI